MSHNESKRSWSLKTKLTFFTSLSLLISIWSLAFYASRVFHQEMEYVAEAQQFSAVSYIAAQINEELEIRLKSIEKISSEITPAIFNNTKSLQVFLEQRPLLQLLFNGGVFVTGIDGIAIVDVPLSSERININYIDRTSVSIPIKEGKSIIGRPAMGKKLAAPIFSISAPIYDSKGTVIGVLVGTINLNKPSFLDDVTNKRYGKTGGYLLVAPQHQLVVTATDKRRIMTPTSPPGAIQLLDRFKKGHEGSGITIDPLGKEMLASAKGIPVAGWYLVAALPTAEAFAPIHKMEKHILLATIFLTICAAGFTWLISRRLLLPMFTTISVLSDMTESGCKPQPLQILREDEIGQLIGSFNNLLNTLVQREDALQKSEKRLSTAANAASFGIYFYDFSHSQASYYSPEFLSLFGLQPGSLLELDEHDIVKSLHPDDRPVFVEQVKAAKDPCGSGILDHEHRIFLPDGQIRWLRVIGKTTFSGKQQTDVPLCANGIIQNITERKQIEEERSRLLIKVQDQAAELEAIISSMAIGLVVYDMDGKAIRVNDTAAELFPIEALVNLTVEERYSVFSWERDDGQLFQLNDLPIARALRGETTHSIIIAANISGYKLWLSSSASPILANDGKVLGAVGTFFDISETRKINKDLQISLAEKEVLLREVHHRVKNNMAAIVGLLDLQRRAMNDPHCQTVMTDLSSRIRAMSLVHEKLYRSDSLSKIDFQEYLQSLISHLRTSFGSPHIHCEIAAQGVEMPLDLAVPCGMIVNELVINALKYAFPMERSGLKGEDNRILVAISHDHDTFTLSVADNGVGLPPELDLNTTTTLGLSLVQMLGQHQLGGRYEVNQIGGTRFTLTFSLHEGKKTYA